MSLRGFFSRRWVVGCLIGGGVLLLGMLGLGLLILGMVFSGDDGTNACMHFGKKKIGIVRIQDVILSSERTVRQLKRMREESSIVAVILRIESPGGGVAASQEIFEAVKKFKSANKKIYASFGSVGASGGYYIACAADSIWANPGTITGSIGVIFQFPFTEDLLKKIGVGVETIKSGKYKDVGSFHRRTSPDERLYLQSLIDDTYQQFQQVVVEFRHLDTAALHRISDGRIFTGRQALELGLVDKLGTLEDVTAKVAADFNL